MEMRSAFVVGIKTREGLQCYAGPFPREDEALRSYCDTGARIIYFERPDSPGVEAWRAVNNRWERCEGWTPERQNPAPRGPVDFNRAMQLMESDLDARRKGTRDHLCSAS